VNAKPILVVGSVALDSVHTGTENALEVLGGAASYFSISASLFAPVRLVAIVGEDFPMPHRELFQHRGIDLEGLQVGKGRTFRWRAHYWGPRLESRETLETQLNVFADFHPALPPAYRSSPIVFLANIQPALQLEVLDQVKSADFIACDTMNLWIETDRPGLERLFRRVHCVLISDEEAAQFSGDVFLPAAARAIQSYGPRMVIIKQGEHGSLLFYGDRVFSAPPVLLQSLRDPTGAGDAFAGGLLGSIAANRIDGEAGFRRAMLYGNVLGSLAVEDFSVERIVRADRSEVERRFSALTDMISIDPRDG
jgi:sugar/nucleoside kinase (ribokinase family)